MLDHALTYPIALAVISVFVALLERWFGHRPQPALRPRIASDLCHLVFNGHFLGVILFGLAGAYLLPWLDAGLDGAGLRPHVYRNAAASWPIAAQIAVALVVIDFLQWGVHVALHRFGPLWELHKTHHSVVDGEMDWIASFRFQWTEVVIYRSALYLPLAWFGFLGEAVMVHAVFGTLIGHLNHANLDWDYGPLRHVFNNPRMHLWHHDHDATKTVNFGIIFSCWDYLFGTAHVPNHPPARIGFPGVERFPKTFFSQTAWPIGTLLPPALREGASTVLGVLLLASGAWLLTPGPARTAPEGATPMLGERQATSQPADTTLRFAYARDQDEATARIADFGQEAARLGFALPEFMVSADELAAALGSPRLALARRAPPGPSGGRPHPIGAAGRPG